MEFPNVTALAKANLYFEGKVISHTIRTADGSRKTLGVALPGEYHFNTEAAEQMDIVEGACRYQIDGTSDSFFVTGPGGFKVPANSGFAMIVTGQPCHYVCSFT